MLSHASAAEYAIAQAAAASTAEHEPSLCKIMASDGISTYWLPQFLPSFLEQHPQIDIALMAAADRYGPQASAIRFAPTVYGSSVRGSRVRAAWHHAFYAFRCTEVRPRARPAHAALRPRSASRARFGARHERARDARDVGQALGRTALLTNMNGALCETVRHGGGIALLPTFAGLLDPAHGGSSADVQPAGAAFSELRTRDRQAACRSHNHRLPTRRRIRPALNAVVRR